MIEERPRETEVVVMAAEAMADSLGAEGRVALHGIRFGLDSATIRPDSEPALGKIARLLQEDPALELRSSAIPTTRAGSITTSSSRSAALRP